MLLLQQKDQRVNDVFRRVRLEEILSNKLIGQELAIGEISQGMTGYI